MPRIGKPYLPIFTARIQPVIVVPTFAPMMTPMAWCRSIRPEFTRPMTITVVMEDDWTRHVTPVPTPVAMMRLSVTALIILRSLEPAIACMPSERFFIPMRNMPRPPMIEKTMSEIVRI